MAQPASDAAYIAHAEAMTRALEAPNGVHVTFESEKAAKSFQHLCHSWRARLRRKNGGQSPYDGLRISVHGAQLTIAKQDPSALKITEF